MSDLQSSGFVISWEETKGPPINFAPEPLIAVGDIYIVTFVDKSFVTIQAAKENGLAVNIDKLLNTIEELAEDLEDWVFKEYCQEDGKIPTRMESSYNRDMIIVNKARALLAEARGVKA